MSRYSVSNPIEAEKACQRLYKFNAKIPTVGKWHIAYGFDFYCGFFLQLFPADVVAEETGIECVDIDTRLNKLSGVTLSRVLYDISEYCTEKKEEERVLVHAQKAENNLEF